MLILQSETGRRTLIDLYLLEALEAEQDKIAVFCEAHIGPVAVTPQTKVHGDLDYLITVERKIVKYSLLISLATSEIARVERLRRSGFPTSGKFVIVEAKKDETFGAASGQLLAELKAIWNMNQQEESIGVLSDGLRWQFWVLSASGSTCYTSKTLHHDFECTTILGLLKPMLRGRIPAGVIKKD